MENTGWMKIDEGLRDLMQKNDSLANSELENKSRRLKHLSDFVKTLKQRVDERVRGVRVGPIEPLFTEFFKARSEVDRNN